MRPERYRLEPHVVSAPPPHLAYRADIDGLRALAILPVMLFHFGLPWVSGGFVGVDVFFVISGYLITSILWRDIASGRFSVLTFYERRVRRIAPALLTVLAFTSVAAFLSFIPRDLVAYAHSLGATLLFVSNFSFYSSLDYFSVSAELMPLLHTWSLAVEEQFYIVFPLALFWLRRFRPRTVLMVLAAVALVSVGISVVQTASNPQAAFYLPFSRIWELLLGSLVALMPWRFLRLLQRDALGWLGIALILAAVFAFDAETPFPGVAAIVPCLGAALVLASGRGSSAAVLGTWPLRFTGAISYSLYLWHWPLVSLYRYHFGGFGSQLPLSVAAGLVVASFALATLSWRFVESPWRQKAGFWTRRRVFAGAGASAIALLGVAAMLHEIDDFHSRFRPDVARFAAAALDTNPARKNCDALPLNRIASGNVCRIGAEGVEPTFAVIGDSIADAFVPGIDMAAKANGTSGLVLTFAGCQPLVGATSSLAKPQCGPFLDAVTTLLRSATNIDSIVVVGRWAAILEGRRFGEQATEKNFLVDAETVQPSYAENERVFERSMRRLAESLPDRRLWIAAFLPEQPVNVPRTLAMQALRGAPLFPGIERASYDARNAHVRQVLDRLATKLGFRLIDLGDVACDADRCPVVDGDARPLYADDNHPSRTAVLGWQAVFAEATRPR